jgi:hypothetical protein
MERCFIGDREIWSQTAYGGEVSMRPASCWRETHGRVGVLATPGARFSGREFHAYDTW